MPFETRPSSLAFPGLAALTLMLGACLNVPDPDAASTDPLVITETGTVSYPAEQSPERAAAVADMRARGAAAELMPYPDVFQRQQNVRLAAREEPAPVAEVDRIEAELAAIARRQANAVSPQELAALKARAAELRRLAAAAQAAR